MSKESLHDKRTLQIRADDHIVGPDRATITLLAYCDFECPYCGRAYPIIKRLRGRFPDRLRFVFRHFPLVRKHPYAQQAAEAAEAADAQGRFWAMHDLLFEHQEDLEEDDLFAYAEALGLDLERFGRDRADRRVAMRVSRDVESGRRNGVSGTPMFFLNGSRHTDEETLEDLVLRASERRSV
jgi:protein-disulfide isomerase